MPQSARRRFDLIYLAVALLVVALVVMIAAAFLYFRNGHATPQPTDQHPKAPTLTEVVPAGQTTSTASVKAGQGRAVTKIQSGHTVPDPLMERIASVASDYDRLAKNARAGDVESALKLEDVLRACSHEVPRTQAALDDRIKQIAVDYPEGSPSYVGQVQFATIGFQQCQRFNTSQIDGWRTWLTIAAATGDRNAEGSYVFWGRPDDPKSDTYYQDTRDYIANSKKYLDDLIAAGDTTALLSESAAYAGGDQALYDPDPVKQYAYMYAYCLATECRSMTLTLLQKLEAGLSPQDLSNATSQGQAIYKQCCAK